MTKDELIQKLSDIEWEDFEVKEAKSEIPKSSWKTVSAFSNTNGGWLVFGISQKGKIFEIKGVNNVEKIEKDFLNTIYSEKYNTRLFVTPQKYIFNNKTIIGFYIPVSRHKPVYFNNPSNTFIRQGSSGRKAHKPEIDSMFRDQAYGTKTTDTVKGSSINDLHIGSIRSYRDYMIRFNPNSIYNKHTDEEFFRKTKVIVYSEVSFAGLLMFGKRSVIDDIFVDFRIDLLEIPAKSYAEAKPRFTFRLEEQENLWEYYFALFERIKNKIEIPFKMSEEGFAFGDSEPLKALREALVNMLMHADYFSPAKSRIRLFSNRIEFFNPGSLPVPLEELLETDISLPRNPVLAKLFRAVRLAENAGFGFDKMMDGWKEYNRDQSPVFSIGVEYSAVTFYYNTHKDTDKHLSNNEQSILKQISENSFITTNELATKVGINQRNVKKNIDKLKAKCIVIRRGAARGGYWEILNTDYH